MMELAMLFAQYFLGTLGVVLGLLIALMMFTLLMKVVNFISKKVAKK